MITQDSLRAAFGFLESNVSHIERQVNEAVYPEIQYPALVPVDTSAPPFAKSVTYYSSDKFGKAEFINGNSNDIPVAGSELAQHQVGVYMAAVGCAWGYEELNQAILAGVPLQAEDAKAARRASEEFIDRIALRGDTAKGFQGLISSTEVTPENAATGSWGSATGDQMVADVNQAILGSSTATNYATVADTVLLPFPKLERLGNVRLDGTTSTAYQYLLTNNTYTMMTGRPLTVRGVRGLETAGAGGVARMVAYRRDPDVLKLHLPMPHQFLPIEKSGPLNFILPGVFRVAGLDIRRPKEVRYIDGI